MVLFAVVLSAANCSDDEPAQATSSNAGGDGPDDEVGNACVTVDDCFPGLDQTSLAGEVECLDRVENGYCTHQCETNDDCCSVEGECEDGVKQVCAPFESTGLMLCFLSCEEDDLPPEYQEDALGGAAGMEIDGATAFCKARGHAEFTCRSTGGGTDNKKVCVAGGN